MLQALDRRRVDVGELSADFTSSIPGSEESPEPAVLLARIFAHIGHRLPLIQRIEKRLEGRDRKAGLGSDLSALAVQLYLRNRDLIARFVVDYMASQRDAKATKDPKEGPHVHE